MPATLQAQTLTHGWSFKQTDTDEWLPVAKVPTNVHLDLLDNKKYERRKTTLETTLMTWQN